MNLKEFGIGGVVTYSGKIAKNGDYDPPPPPTIMWECMQLEKINDFDIFMPIH